MHFTRLFPILGLMAIMGCAAARHGGEMQAANTIRASVLFFVTTDCPISNGYAPEINRLYRTYKDSADFTLVYSDPDLTPTQIDTHYHDYAYQCGKAFDPTHEIARKAGATVTPEVAVYQPDGQIIYRGRIDDRYLDLGKPRLVTTVHDLEDVLKMVSTGLPVVPRTTTAFGCHIPE